MVLRPQVLSEFDAKQRKDFLCFTTGSPQVRPREAPPFLALPAAVLPKTGAFPCASAAALPKTDAFHCASAAMRPTIDAFGCASAAADVRCPSAMLPPCGQRLTPLVGRGAAAAGRRARRDEPGEWHRKRTAADNTQHSTHAQHTARQHAQTMLSCVYYLPPLCYHVPAVSCSLTAAYALYLPSPLHLLCATPSWGNTLIALSRFPLAHPPTRSLFDTAHWPVWLRLSWQLGRLRVVAVPAAPAPPLTTPLPPAAETHHRPARRDGGPERAGERAGRVPADGHDLRELHQAPELQLGGCSADAARQGDHGRPGQLSSVMRRHAGCVWSKPFVGWTSFVASR